jgi:hypothetical protein
MAHATEETRRNKQTENENENNRTNRQANRLPYLQQTPFLGVHPRQ